jgi:hypothetical protein
MTKKRIVPELGVVTSRLQAVTAASSRQVASVKVLFPRYGAAIWISPRSRVASVAA